MEIDPKEAIPVNSVGEEYAFVAGQRCTCQGRLQVVRQALLFHAGRPYDLLETACQACQQQRLFLFDISAFFGR